ncbi:MAG TPA: polysaccharide biosynthesis/export family protein [Candidatus Polarisedimenticolia bacterium]
MLLLPALLLVTGALAGPQAAEPVADSEDYVIGVEDVLFVSVWKNPDLSREVPVRPDGKITLPLIDDIPAVGLTPARLKEVLTERWRAFITAPEVSVIVTQVNSLKVYMVGEILKPGILVLKSRTRLLQALSQAGGFTAFADRARVVVLRNAADGKETRMEFNYRKILSGARPEDNIFLMPGDTVIVF